MESEPSRQCSASAATLRFGAFGMGILANVLTVVLLLLYQVTGAHGGIAGFHKWFSRAFPTAVKDAHPKQQELFDHVCIDMNQMLHVAVRKASDENHAMKRLYKGIDRTLKQCMPRQSVVFAFDGSAPLAKLLVQRNRRENEKRCAGYSMSALHLSPGTEFMDEVASAMEYYAFQQCQKQSFRGVKFYISGASVPGEGELKCVDWIKHMCAAGTEESAVIVGGDADLILQGLALTQVKNMFIFSPSDNGAARLSSVWEVVRSLEKLFPGQSEFVRADLMLLMILNGNDYLPKTRGVAFHTCFLSYAKLKAKKYRDEFLVDGEGRTFSVAFLADLLMDMGKHRTVEDAGLLDMRNRYPPAGALLKQAIQQGKLGDDVELEIHSIPTVGAEPLQYRSSVYVWGREYSWIHTVVKKKTAMHDAAAMLLEELLPDVYDKFLEQEAARLLEEESAKGDAEMGGDPDFAIDQGEGGQWQAGGEVDESIPCVDRGRPLFDVEAYLSGILWNIQMYLDGYAPNFYWHYTPPYGPSCLEIASWMKENPEIMARMTPPVSPAPPLPAAVSGLCMMPMTESGREVLPKRFQPLLVAGSPLREALEWRGRSAGLDVPSILRALQEQAPGELVSFTRDGSRKSNAWTVVYLDLSAPAHIIDAPRAPTREFASLESTVHPRNLERMQVEMLPATTAPRCEAWSSPRDPTTWLQPPSVHDEPYKEAFSRKGKGDGAGKGAGFKRQGRKAAPKSVAWRKETSGSAKRPGGGRERGPGRGKKGADGRGGDYPRAAPAVVEERVSPPVARHGGRTSMCLGGAVGRRPSCRLRL